MKYFPLSSALVILACAVITVAIWARVNRPSVVPPWPDTVQGIAFSPYQKDQDATLGDTPTLAQIESDLALLSGKTHAIRTYGTDGTLKDIPRLAARYHLNVSAGAWIDTRLEHNQAQLQDVIELARLRNVVRVIVGNEVLLHEYVPLETLIGYLDQVRGRVNRPVSTAESWHIWLRYPELARHVDFLAVHLLPFWEGVDVDHALGFMQEKLALLRQAYPDKPIVIAEVGWPSEGRTRGDAQASRANEARFLRRFLHLAQKEKYIYYIMEAFDQPWKRATEGAVGAYWGIYDVNRVPKFPLDAPIVKMPRWHMLASVSVAIGAILLLILYIPSRTLVTRGRTFLAVIVYSAATVIVWTTYEYLQQYLTVTSVIVGLLLLFSMIGVLAVLISEAHEWAEAHWISMRRRGGAASVTTGEWVPRVSIHVPAYNEPPAMLIHTLDALAALDYPDFEVLVIDNNTLDEEVWRPVQAHCAALGERFRFFHVAPLSGFKAGALNYALRETDSRADIVAVIDSDYIVEPSWLRDLVPCFSDPGIAMVQAPQDYRDADQNAFKAMCHEEYRGFFSIGMVTRNERNAIIQHGTMTMVRREVLQRLGGWAEWCITEDAELGLRIFAGGSEAMYISRSYGRGLIPDTYTDYKKQRYRWAYGAMQIMKRHAAGLFALRRTGLSAGQRYHFIAGWLPWLADGANLLFNIAALVWSLGMLASNGRLEPPLMIFSILPLSLFVFKLAKLVHLYISRVGANVVQTLAAALAGLSLTHTIGRAVLQGLVTSDLPFMRTPKQATPHALLQALAAAREETLLLVALLFAAATLQAAPTMVSDDYRLWVMILVIQAIPYAASLCVSVISAFPMPARWMGRFSDAPTRY